MEYNTLETVYFQFEGNIETIELEKRPEIFYEQTMNQDSLKDSKLEEAVKD